VFQPTYDNRTSCDAETIALLIAWLNECYGGQSVHFALLGVLGVWDNRTWQVMSCTPIRPVDVGHPANHSTAPTHINLKGGRQPRCQPLRVDPRGCPCSGQRGAGRSWLASRPDRLMRMPGISAATTWLALPCRGLLEWWFSFRQCKIHQGRESPLTCLDSPGQYRRLMEQRERQNRQDS